MPRKAKDCMSEKNLFRMQYSALPDVLRAKGNIKYGYYEKIRFIPHRSYSCHRFYLLQRRRRRRTAPYAHHHRPHARRRRLLCPARQRGYALPRQQVPRPGLQARSRQNAAGHHLVHIAERHCRLRLQHRPLFRGKHLHRHFGDRERLGSKSWAAPKRASRAIRSTSRKSG